MQTVTAVISVSQHLEGTFAARPSGYCFQLLSVIKPYNFACSFPICLQINTVRNLLPPSLKSLKSNVHLRLTHEKMEKSQCKTEPKTFVFFHFQSSNNMSKNIKKKGHGARMISIQSLLLRIK